MVKLSGFCGCVHGAFGRCFGVARFCSSSECLVTIDMPFCEVVCSSFVLGFMRAVTLGWSQVGDGGLGICKRRSCCGLSRLGLLLLRCACCYCYCVGFSTGSGSEFRQLLISYSGRRYGSHENFCRDLGGHNGRLRGRGKREQVRGRSQTARGGSLLL